MRGSLAAVVALFVGACATSSAPHSESSKHRDFLLTDSRLRVIATSDQGIFSTAGLVEAQRITCTEPSPDVATTLANSFGTGISIFGRGSASLTAQQVEGLVQLGERTAAIQLLRDKMYQTCLAYSNGAISGTTYSLIMSRLDDAIVTLSLADGAAGAFGRSLGGLGGEASASAEAAVMGLSADIAKIEDQASKLAAANKKVDDAAKALEGHKSAQPADGKEQEYQQQTETLEKALAETKAERNALLELMRSMASNAGKATGKISTVQSGGGLTANPNAVALREMQGDFLLADSSRDLIFACMVELGLRGDGQSDKSLNTMIAQLEALFLKAPGAETGAVYAGAILRARGTALAKLCAKELPTLIKDAASKAHEHRLLRAKLSSQNSVARYTSDAAKSAVRERELFLEAIKTCNAEFKDDIQRKKACLDQVIPVGDDAQAVAKAPAPKASAKKK